MLPNLPEAATSNAVPRVVLTSKHKVIFLLLPNFNVATVMGYDANVWYRTPWGQDPQVEKRDLKGPEIFLYNVSISHSLESADRLFLVCSIFETRFHVIQSCLEFPIQLWAALNSLLSRLCLLSPRIKGLKNHSKWWLTYQILMEIKRKGTSFITYNIQFNLMTERTKNCYFTVLGSQCGLLNHK